MAENKGIRFIRKGGRIIPIRAKDYDKSPKMSAAKLGAASIGSTLAASALLGSGVKSKGASAVAKLAGGSVFAVASPALGLSAFYHGIRSPLKIGKKEGIGSGIGSYLSQGLSNWAGGAVAIGAAGVGSAILKGPSKKAFRAYRIYRSGLKLIK